MVKVFLGAIIFLEIFVYSGSLIAAGFDEKSQCHVLVKDNQRKDCEDTQLEIFKNQLSIDKKSWSKELTDLSKKQKLTRLELTLSQQTYYLNHLKNKLELLKAHKGALEKAKTVKSASDDPKAQEELGKALKQLGVKKSK